jgi:hypothetical protein
LTDNTGGAGNVDLRRTKLNERDKIGKGHKKEANNKGSRSIMDKQASQCCHPAILNCTVTEWTNRQASAAILPY